MRSSVITPELDSETIEKNFPFLVVIDSQYRICFIGKSLLRIHGEDIIGDFFGNIFSYQRPSDPNELFKLAENNKTNTVFICKHLKSGLRFRGGITKKNKFYYFFWFPIVTNIESLQAKQLTFDDFPSYSGVNDYLVLLKTQQNAINSTLELMKKLKQHEEKLEKALALSEKASVLKSEFVANMSHEIRTPINGVIGMLSLLEKKELSAECKNMLNIARNSSNALLGIINDILDFSKIEADKLDIVKNWANPHELVDEAIDTIIYQANEQGVTLEVDLTNVKSLRCFIDQNRVKQILLNILSNAVKFTTNGSIFIHGKLEKKHKKNILNVSIKDEGIGMRPEVLETIFESFRQAEKNTSKVYGGTGLGLAISRKLCRLMGGDIKVESYIGKGTTFSFSVEVSELLPAEACPDLKPLLYVDKSSSRRVLVEKYSEVLNINVLTAPKVCANIITYFTRQKKPSTIVISSDIFNEFEQLSSLLDSNVSVYQVSDINKIHRESKIIECGHIALPISLFKIKNLLQSNSDALVQDGNYPPSLDGVKVLVVEDNIINQQVVCGTLEGFGVKYSVASNGLEAIDILESQLVPFDIILMDCRMPLMDGYETTNLILTKESLQNHCDTPILALTADAYDDEKKRCFQAGMSGFLTKPIMPEELQKALLNAINRSL